MFILMKLFRTGSTDVVEECRRYYGIELLRSLGVSRSCKTCSSCIALAFVYTIKSVSSQTMTIAILSLDCYTKTHIDDLINSFFSLCTLNKLRFDNFLLNEDNDLL